MTDAVFRVAVLGGNNLLVWSPRLHRFTSDPEPQSLMLVSDPEDLGQYEM